MNSNDTTHLLDLERCHLAAREAHGYQLLDDIARQSLRRADRIHTRRQLAVAALVLAILFVATPPVMAQQLPDIPVRCDTQAQQQLAIATAREIVTQL